FSASVRRPCMCTLAKDERGFASSWRTQMRDTRELLRRLDLATPNTDWASVMTRMPVDPTAQDIKQSGESGVTTRKRITSGIVAFALFVLALVFVWKAVGAPGVGSQESSTSNPMGIPISVTYPSD